MNERINTLIKGVVSGHPVALAPILTAPPLSLIVEADPSAAGRFFAASETQLTTGWHGQRCAWTALEFDETTFRALSARHPHVNWRITWRTRDAFGAYQGLILKGGSVIFKAAGPGYEQHCLRWLLDEDFPFAQNTEFENWCKEDVEPNFPNEFERALEVLG
jgi:hypothetical protein